jgi:hypothetical protein
MAIVYVFHQLTATIALVAIAAAKLYAKQLSSATSITT